VAGLLCETGRALPLMVGGPREFGRRRPGQLSVGFLMMRLLCRPREENSEQGAGAQARLSATTLAENWSCWARRQAHEAEKRAGFAGRGYCDRAAGVVLGTPRLRHQRRCPATIVHRGTRMESSNRMDRKIPRRSASRPWTPTRAGWPRLTPERHFFPSGHGDHGVVCG